MKAVATMLTKWDLKLTFTQRVRRLIRRLWQWLKNLVHKDKVAPNVNLTRLVQAIEEAKKKE